LIGAISTVIFKERGENDIFGKEKPGQGEQRPIKVKKDTQRGEVSPGRGKHDGRSGVYFPGVRKGSTTTEEGPGKAFAMGEVDHGAI